MSTEENKAMVRRHLEQVWNQENMGAADELFSAEYVNHGPERDTELVKHMRVAVPTADRRRFDHAHAYPNGYGPYIHPSGTGRRWGRQCERHRSTGEQCVTDTLQPNEGWLE